MFANVATTMIYTKLFFKGAKDCYLIEKTKYIFSATINILLQNHKMPMEILSNCSQNLQVMQKITTYKIRICIP